jgi:hypothetical protein
MLAVYLLLSHSEFTRAFVTKRRLVSAAAAMHCGASWFILFCHVTIFWCASLFRLSVT